MNKRLFIFVGGLVIVVAAVVGLVVYFALGGRVSSPAEKPSGYKAVSLMNGQTYYGKVVNEKADPVVLRDVYYIQVLVDQETSAQRSSQQQPRLNLAKLTNDFIGPTDELRIVRAQIILFEDLRESSQVVQAIRQFQQQPLQGQIPSQQLQQSPQPQPQR